MKRTLLVATVGLLFTSGVSAQYESSIEEFNAIVNGKKIEVSWRSVNPIGTNQFLIERSRNGKEFEMIGYIKAATPSLQQMSYFETDVTPKRGRTYYRLKQIGGDGVQCVSNIVPVDYKGKRRKRIVLNPIGHKESVVSFAKNPNQKHALVILRDKDGNEHIARAILQQEGKSISGSIVDESLAPGCYLITAASENSMYSRRVYVK